MGWPYPSRTTETIRGRPKHCWPRCYKKMYRYTSNARRVPAWRWLFALCALLMGSAWAGASPLLTWPADNVGHVALDGHFTVLVDNARALNADAVLGGRHDAEFMPAARHNTNPGFTRAEVWARFVIHYESAHGAAPVLVLSRPLIDDIDLYAVGPNGMHSHVSTGDNHSFATRPINNRGFAFLLAPKAGETVTYYMRVRSATGAVALPLELMDSATFHAESASENYLRGAYLGFMAGLALCALVLFVLVRNVAYAYYCQYLVTLVLLVCAADGYAMQFLWPNAPLAQQILPAALLALCNVTGTLFARSFLNLPEVTPASEPWYALGAVTSAVGVGVHVFHPGALGVSIIMATSVVLGPIALWGCIQAWRAGDRVAGYLLFGWLAFLIGMSFTLLDMVGALPTSAWAANGVYLGSLGEFVALAVGLSDRLWNLQRAREAQIAAANADLAALNTNLEGMVRSRTRELEERNRELSELAVRDSLTGLYNHSTTIELLEQLLNQSQRYEFPIATVMLDIDNFKQLNDSYGHQLGDHVLEEVSQTLADSVRGADVVGRYGGEEFLVVMPHADALAAREYGERLLGLIREIRIGNSHISASIGVSVFHPRGHRASAQDVIRRADEALYRSKREGRDRLTIDSLSLVPTKDAERRFEKPPPRS